MNLTQMKQNYTDVTCRSQVTWPFNSCMFTDFESNYLMLTANVNVTANFWSSPKFTTADTKLVLVVAYMAIFPSCDSDLCPLCKGADKAVSFYAHNSNKGTEVKCHNDDPCPIPPSSTCPMPSVHHELAFSQNIIRTRHKQYAFTT